MDTIDDAMRGSALKQFVSRYNVEVMNAGLSALATSYLVGLAALSYNLGPVNDTSDVLATLTLSSVSAFIARKDTLPKVIGLWKDYKFEKSRRSDYISSALESQG